MRISGQLRKMTHEAETPVQYFLSLDEKPVPITAQVGNEVTLRFLGAITCIECGRKIKKTYNQGYCFPCARDLPENAMCAVRPELCQHQHGNEADREFYREYCAVDHYVYLSLTSGVKVGITRHFNVPSRWIDQGAVQRSYEELGRIDFAGEGPQGLTLHPDGRHPLSCLKPQFGRPTYRLSF